MYSNSASAKRVSRRKGKKQKKVSKVKLFIYFIIFQFLFGIGTAPWIVYYGPFNNLKRNIVGTAMSTFTHQYLATLFLSDAQIAKIRAGSGGPSSNQSQNLNDINTAGHNEKIECKKIQANKFNGLLLIVHDPTKVKIGYTSKLGVQGETTSQIAKHNNAIAAINGGGFKENSSGSQVVWTGTGAVPTGIVISNGKLVYPKEVDEVSTQRGCIAITRSGVLVVGDHSVRELLNENVVEAINFGPTLIVNGVEETRDSFGNSIDSQGAQPRTAIGQRKDGAILLLTIDGRQGLQMGATISDIQRIMKEENAYNAVNLDGGASTTMYYNGHVINNPCDKFGERTVATAIIVKH
ncbi:MULTISPECIES: phosphodiester glycosidase family protein [Clostridium]|uniref:phosphodiester glycosidase family protein n=1 Tax=Clostridium TaxID=1485 RepID=UPI0008263BAC|nr:MULTISPECIES: phosphodiester glycosidase family protein [Clostridium]PJI09485.1 exopolysaccharide biosynthesis protein [Clostridium sp. CT7]